MDKAAIQIGGDSDAIKECMKALDYILTRGDLDTDTKKLAIMCLTASIQIRDVTITGCHIETR